MCNDTIYEDAVSYQPGTMRHDMSNHQSLESPDFPATRPLSSSYRPKPQTQFGSSHLQSAKPVYYRLPYTAKPGRDRSPKVGKSLDHHVRNPIPIPEMAEWELPVMKQALLREPRPDRAAALLARNILLLLTSLFVYSLASHWLPGAIKKALFWLCLVTLTFFTANITTCVYVLLKPRDQCFDLPLTPRQRQLLGLLPTPLLTDGDTLPDPQIPQANPKLPSYLELKDGLVSKTRPALFPILPQPTNQVAELKPIVVLQRQRDMFAKHFSLNFNVES